MKEHFFIVGAQRSGTTYLYEILNQHPEICMAEPVRPEPKYFMNKSINELDHDDYKEKYFSHGIDCKIFGEKSTSYYEQENSAKLIASMFPSAKIIFFLRDPVKRALSNYFFSANNGFEKRSLNEVFVDQHDSLMKKPVNVSVNPFDYLGRGEYNKFIALYKKYFSDDQIKVVIFEDFVNNNAEVKKLYKFLEVDDTYLPKNINKVVNSSKKTLEVDDTVLEAITKYFDVANKKLEKLLQRDISQWL